MLHITNREDVFQIVKEYIAVPSIIVEVGAFTGQDTVRMAKAFPESKIYAFEPVPELYNALIATTAPYPKVTPYSAAVSDHKGTMPLHVAYKPNGKITQASSLRKPKERLAHSPITFPEIIDVPTITLTSWAQQIGVDHIDLLWLDTQGHEMTILQSIKDTLLLHVRAIYTEVAFTEAYEGQTHADQVTAWLIDAGFTPIAQDFENPPKWFFGNLLFIRTNTKRVIRSR